MPRRVGLPGASELFRSTTAELNEAADAHRAAHRTAEHRAPALEACRWLIDELKERVPIWKKEVTPQGDSWIVPHP